MRQFYLLVVLCVGLWCLMTTCHGAITQEEVDAMSDDELDMRILDQVEVVAHAIFILHDLRLFSYRRRDTVTSVLPYYTDGAVAKAMDLMQRVNNVASVMREVLRGDPETLEQWKETHLRSLGSTKISLKPGESMDGEEVLARAQEAANRKLEENAAAFNRDVDEKEKSAMRAYLETRENATDSL